MAQDHGSHGTEVAHRDAPAAGTAVISTDQVENPGFPPYRPRVTDLDPAKDKAQERRVIAMFLVSALGSVLAVVAYIAFPITPGDMESVRTNNLLFGLAGALALLAVGVGAVHWSKSLMHGHDLVEQRHDTRGSEATRASALDIFRQANEESGFGRRKFLRNSLIGALVVSPVPAVVLLRDLAPSEDPVPLLKKTMWAEGVRLTRDPSGTPIRASDVTLGSAFHVIPEGLHESSHPLEEKAKAAVLLMRLKPEQLEISEGREDWNYAGIIAYSKICTHAGGPAARSGQTPHHPLCPCHQSQFDITREAAVIFGPAKRPLPQLPITVDSEGYLVARSDFTEPVGPSFWERSV